MLHRCCTPGLPESSCGYLLFIVHVKGHLAGSGMASERAALERQQQKLRQGSSGPPARHARFGGLYVRRYHAEHRGSVVRSNPLVPDLPPIPELKKISKILVSARLCLYKDSTSARLDSTAQIKRAPMCSDLHAQ